MNSPSVCPQCGASLKKKATFCRECGSDFKTGWKSSEEVDYQSIELPEENEYEDFLKREGLGGRTASRLKPWVLFTGLILVFALILLLVL